MIEFFKRVWADNPSIAALVVSLGIGSLTGFLYFFKDLILSFLTFIEKQFFTSLTISNTNIYFYALINYLIENKNLSCIRHLELSKEGSSNEGDSYCLPALKLSDSSSYMIIFGTLLHVSIKSHILENAKDKYIEIKLSKLGRSFKLFGKILQQLKESCDIPDTNNLYETFYKSKNIYIDAGKFLPEPDPLTSEKYLFDNHIRKRSFDEIFLPDSLINQIKNRIEYFINNRDFYKKHNIPYHLGILIHGLPGCGKTSLIKAIISYFDLKSYILPVNKLENLDSTFLSTFASQSYNIIDTYLKNIKPQKNISEDIRYVDYRLSSKIEDKLLKNKTIDELTLSFKKANSTTLNELFSIIIEDIDTSYLVKDRDSYEIDSKKNYHTFSNILNSFDGLTTPEGYVIIATTNHINKLDPALTRPGRFDMVIEIPPINLEVYNKFTKSFFNKTEENIKIKKNITVAKMQELVLRQYTYEQFKNEISL